MKKIAARVNEGSFSLGKTFAPGVRKVIYCGLGAIRSSIQVTLIVNFFFNWLVIASLLPTSS
jgi:hypothetical protein